MADVGGPTKTLQLFCQLTLIYYSTKCHVGYSKFHRTISKLSTFCHIFCPRLNTFRGGKSGGGHQNHQTKENNLTVMADAGSKASVSKTESDSKLEFTDIKY